MEKTLLLLTVTILAMASMPAVMSTDESELRQFMRVNTDFGLSLYRKISEQANARNIFCSPYSIFVAFAMTYYGAAGQTREQIGQVFGYSAFPDKSDLTELFQGLSENLFTEDAVYQLDEANRLFAQTGMDLHSEYRSDIEAAFGGEVKQTDFSSDPEEARKEINTWVEEKTQGTIQDLFPEGIIDANTVLVLVNAIYFKAAWQYQFSPENTVEEPFHTDRGPVPVEMMKMREHLSYASSSNLGCSVLSLPYANSSLSMVIILPDEDSNLATIENRLTANQLNDLIRNGTTQRVSVTIPKFDISQKMSLNDLLQQLGLTDPFSTGADFSGITSSDRIYINEAIHEAFVKVNEEGTEASAATGISVNRMSANRYRNFLANRPFLFVIRDSVTESVLFLGRFADPGTTRRPLHARLMARMPTVGDGDTGGQGGDSTGQEGDSVENSTDDDGVENGSPAGMSVTMATLVLCGLLAAVLL